MRKPRQPDPEVHESDYRVPAAIGTVAWVIALIVLLAMGEGLPESERWWIGVCATGTGLGVFGFLYIPRLLRKRAEAAERISSRD
ncbi:DUF2530 domain-containing protein [Nocardiopsis lambiniae]|uniref:DUF2530 domain-containing protein n=1 Tax=Nocardiopsis lambiniae TaxID=3075539 RepID=A0ABU2M9U5_9ACTN|nr:DUF2530 domain-containing protein [Nocardiopsis sp. DSM 44743]MDT0328940.1 DUF2530 domain-containing protein [Nocardiopsis sp. DSM 44743]